MSPPRIHPAAEVSSEATLGPDVLVWRGAHIREGASIGANTTIGENVYIGVDVRVGAECKIQNGALVYEGVELADGVFVGPGVIFTNDRRPRAVNADGSKKGPEDWRMDTIRVATGASVGAGAILLPGVRIGAWALIAAGSVVTRDVAGHALVAGSPARPIGTVCLCGERVSSCEACGWHA